MKNLILITWTFLTAMTSVSVAQTLLIPEKNMNEETYLQLCEKDGYVCTQDFIGQTLIKAETPLFNDFIENLDLLDDKQRLQIAERTKQVLKNEMISADQLETLILILDKSISLEKNKKIEFLKNQFVQIKALLDQTTEDKSPTTYTLILKKKISAEQLKQLAAHRSILYSVKVAPLSYQMNLKPEEFFLQGGCSNPEISEDFQRNFLGVAGQKKKSVHTQLRFNEECSFTKSINASLKTTGNFISEYKKPLLWTAAAAVAVFFLTKNYEVEFK